MYEKTYPNKRFKLTFQFLKKHIDHHHKILDLGVVNPFSKIMTSNGYHVENTKGEDLDLDTTTITNADVDVVTAFEIFEHLLSPFTVLQDIKTNKLDWLLEKAGWKIIDRKKWTNPTKKIGIRPILRWFTPRYYIVYAERIK